MKSSDQIPQNWSLLRIGDICSTFKSGFGITSNDIFGEGDYPVYGGNGLRGHTAAYTHEGNYVLIGRQGALCGNITLISGRSYVSEHAIAVQTNDQNDLHYLAYNLNFLNLNRFSESSAQPGLSVEKLLRLKILLPPLPVQRKIALILSTWDRAIEKTEQLIAQKQQLKKGLMQQLLTGKVRFKEFVKSKKMKKTKLGMVPEDWEFKRLNEICSTFKSGYGITSKEIDEYGKYTAYGGNGPRGFTNSFTHDGDFFLIGRQGALCGNIVRIKGKNYVSEHAIAVQANQENSNGFLADRLEFFNLNHLSESSAQPGLSVDKLLRVKIPVPPLPEQEKITSALSHVDQEISSRQNQLNKLKMQKKGLMQQLLTGKVRVKH